MKQAFIATLFCLCLALGIQARCTTLPDACGDENVRFEVATQKHAAAPTLPAAGKAQIVFIEVTHGANITARIGMDGQWVGADKADSYFTFDVTPGLHHLCANWQSSMTSWDRQVLLSPLDAEAGKVYYFEVKMLNSGYFHDFAFGPLNVDEAMYLIQTSPLSTATVKK